MIARIRQFIASIGLPFRFAVAIAALGAMYLLGGWRFMGGALVGTVLSAFLLYRGGALSPKEMISIADWAIDFFRKHGDPPTEEDIATHLKK